VTVPSIVDHEPPADTLSPDSSRDEKGFGKFIRLGRAFYIVGDDTKREPWFINTKFHCFPDGTNPVPVKAPR
jgi:hypothetical protein